VLSTQEDLVPTGWCRAHRETWYLMDGAEHKQTWYLVNGTEQNKTRVLLAGDDCDGVGHVKVCARTG
jgi:phage protein U